MCAACGVPTHIPADDELVPQGPAGDGAGRTQPAKFAALRNPTCRVYLVGGMLSMMADNIEHVITYWVLWEKFHSPALTGFEVHQPLAAVPAAVPVLRRASRPA